MRKNNDFACHLEEYAPCASSNALSMAADEGICVMIIPIFLPETGGFREKNFLFLLRHYSRLMSHIVVVEQRLPSSKENLESRVKSESRAHYLDFRTESELVLKSSLVNRGARFAFEQWRARFVWQIDADIFQLPEPVLKSLAILNSKAIPVIKPFVHFTRLPPSETLGLYKLSNCEVENYDAPSPRDLTRNIEPLIGAGSLIFSRHAFESTGGMDETFSGWGWEDVDFSQRLSAQFPIHTFPFRAAHLFHERSKKGNAENALRFFRKHETHFSPEEKSNLLSEKGTWNLQQKICILYNFQDDKFADGYANFLDSHPDISYFKNTFDRPLDDLLCEPNSTNLFFDQLAEAFEATKADICLTSLAFEGRKQEEILIRILIGMGFRFLILTQDLPIHLIPARSQDSSPIASQEQNLEQDYGNARRILLKLFSQLAKDNQKAASELGMELPVSKVLCSREEIAGEISRFLGLQAHYFDSEFLDLPSEEICALIRDKWKQGKSSSE